MSDCFGSFTGLFSSECQSVVTVLIFLAGIIGWGLYYAVPWVWRHTSFKYNFILWFIDHPPPKHTVHNYWFPYSLPIGTFKLCCLTQAVHRFHAARLNFRFLNVDSTNVPTSIVEIIKIEESECDPNYLESMVPDTVGGIEGCYKSNVPSLAANEGRYFWITAKASNPWNGHLSVRMQDITGFRSYGSHEVTISEVPDSPLLVRDVIPKSGFISMKDAAIKLYTETRGNQYQLAAIAESMSGWSGGRIVPGSPDDILNYIATYIAFSKKVALFGKRVPSTAIEQITWSDVRASTFADGATRLVHTYNSSVFFTDLAIRVDALMDLIAQLHFDEGFHAE
jgi:hypothetical protein